MNETATQVGTQNGLSDFFAETPTIETPVPAPEIHQGEITGVLWVANPNKPGGRLSIGLRSTNTGVETDLSIFPPLTFVNNIYATKEEYSTEKPVNPETGAVGQSESEVFARHIQNSTGKATLQFLNTLAQSQGHSTTLPKPETIEDLAGVLNELLGGVQVVFTRSVDKNPRDPEFATILRTRKILSPDVATSPKQMKWYQNNGYRIAWEQ